jgi:hypothetical protein
MSLRRPRWAEHSELCGIRQEIKAKSRLGKPKARILKTSRARPAEIAAKLRATIPSILRIASEHAIVASLAYTLTDPYLGPILQIGSHLKSLSKAIRLCSIHAEAFWSIRKNSRMSKPTTHVVGTNG